MNSLRFLLDCSNSVRSFLSSWARMVEAKAKAVATAVANEWMRIFASYEERNRASKVQASDWMKSENEGSHPRIRKKKERNESVVGTGKRTGAGDSKQRRPNKAQDLPSISLLELSVRKTGQGLDPTLSWTELRLIRKWASASGLSDD